MRGYKAAVRDRRGAVRELKKAAAALAEFTAELFVDRTLIPNQSAAWRIVSPINRSLASFKQIGEIVLRETEFEKTATRKIKRYKLIALS